MIDIDYEQVHQVDILTQHQYLGEKFDQMNEAEQVSHLASRKSEFHTSVDTGYCFVAEDGRNTKKQGLNLLTVKKQV